MAKRPSLHCAGGCGRLIWSGSTSLPEGQATCRACRRRDARIRRPAKPPFNEQRICKTCGTEFTATRATKIYCRVECKPGRQRSTSNRGYGAQHRKLRAEWTPKVDAGQVDCHAVLCLMPDRHIHPGQPWDLGHNPERTAWTGPEHVKCNRSEGARRKVATERARRRPRPPG